MFLCILFINKCTAERHGQLVNISASHSEGPSFKSWLEDRLSGLRFSCFSQSLQTNAEYCLKLGQDRFLTFDLSFEYHTFFDAIFSKLLRELH
jgi:hypothetical protein